MTYNSIDVCYNFNRFLQIVESIYLDRGFNYDAKSKKSNMTLSISKVIAIYAEGPPEMMKYLDNIFHGDIRYAGKYASFNSSIDREHFKIYADIVYYIVTHRLKWERLLVFHVQPSSMTFLYELLVQKALNSKLCIQFTEVKSAWNTSYEDYFTSKWFKENKPAVITIGDKYGQVEIINELTKIMKSENITIPILAEGFSNIIRGWQKVPNNFDCFEELSSSFLTTTSKAFERIGTHHDPLNDIVQDIFKTFNNTISNVQREVLGNALRLDKIVTGEHKSCKCVLDYDCTKRNIERRIDIIFKNVRQYSFLNHKNEDNMVETLIMDPKLPSKAPKWTGYCRIFRIRKQYHETVLRQDSVLHTDECTFKPTKFLSQCWRGEYIFLFISNSNFGVRPGVAKDFSESRPKVACGFA